MISEVYKYEVRSMLLMEAMNSVGVCKPEDAAKVWANGVKLRNAALQYSVMSSELKTEYVRQLEESSPNWVTGVSSPWVESFQIVKIQSPNENSRIINLTFYTTTSSGSSGEFSAVITVAREENFWRIIKILQDEGLYLYTMFK